MSETLYDVLASAHRNIKDHLKTSKVAPTGEVLALTNEALAALVRAKLAIVGVPPGSAKEA
jgi:hypothetical protein